MDDDPIDAGTMDIAKQLVNMAPEMSEVK